MTQLLSGVIKDIEHKSNAYEAYERAYENAVTAGIGYIGIGTNYLNDKSLEQKITIDTYTDPTMAFLDPFSVAVDGSDANFGVCIKYINEADAIHEHGDDIKSGDQVANIFGNWTIPEDSVASMVYYEMERSTKKQYYYDDGTITEEKIPEGILLGEREVADAKCHIFKFVGNKVVGRSELPISFIPLVPVYGDNVYLHNHSNIRYCGLVHWLRDSQKLINFYGSNELELAAKAPKAPYVGAAGVFEGFEKQWGTANHKNHAYLEFNQTDSEGNPAAMPQRMDNTAQTQGLIQSKNQAISELGRQTGIFDTAFGMQQSNESGKAVLLRQNQGEIATVHYLQNLESSIAQVGKIVLSLLPYVYDTTRTLTVRTNGQDSQMLEDNLSTYLTPEILADLEVETESGPAYENSRREAIAAILEIGTVMPDKMPLMADILVENLDAPGSKQIAERLRKALPPEFQDGQDQTLMLQQQVAESGQMLEQSQMVIQQQQDQLAQLQGSIQQLQTMVLSKDNETNAKIYNADADRELKFRIATMNNQTDMAQESVKQAGSSERQTQKIQADFTSDMMANENAMEKEVLKLEAELIKKKALSAKDNLELAKEANKQFKSRVPGPISTDMARSQQMIQSIDEFRGQ
tara:strand:+ start:1 stop:1905 length:1905 start_codon:yes stop_codon:yes gene_type:complete